MLQLLVAPIGVPEDVPVIAKDVAAVVGDVLAGAPFGQLGGVAAGSEVLPGRGMKGDVGEGCSTLATVDVFEGVGGGCERGTDELMEECYPLGVERKKKGEKREEYCCGDTELAGLK